MREPTYIESARTMQRIGHAFLALIIAIGLMIWFGMAALFAIEKFGFQMSGRPAVYLNTFILAVAWLLVYRLLRTRRAF